MASSGACVEHRNQINRRLAQTPLQPWLPKIF
jgi:hypothetical protein